MSNIDKLDIMRNLSGSLGHGEFIIVILCISVRTYIFLILKGLISNSKGNGYTSAWITRDIQKVYK